MSHNTSYTVSAGRGLFSLIHAVAVVVIFATVILGMVR